MSSTNFKSLLIGSKITKQVIIRKNYISSEKTGSVQTNTSPPVLTSNVTIKKICKKMNSCD